MKPLARLTLLTLLFLVWQTDTLGTPADIQGPVVRALLFFSPTCPHCHKVINEDLPVIFQRFGGEARVWFDQNRPRDQVAHYLVSNGQLEILLVDASIDDGNRLYMASQEALNIPENRRGVPRLVVRAHVLVGSLEIPEIFPGIIEEGLAAGGIDWPDIAGVDHAVSAFPWLQPLAAAEETGEPATASQSETDPSVEASPPAAGDSAARSPETVAAEVELKPEVERKPDTSPEARPTRATTETVDGPPADEMSGGTSEDSAAAAGDTPPAADDSDAVVEPSLGEADLGMIASRRPNMIELYKRDPVGNSFSVVVLIGMMLSLLVVYGMSQQRATAKREVGQTIPFLSLLGIFVAGYLAYIESTGAEAVCGPVGDCNTVNQSEYAILFGVLPVGVLGLAGYLAILPAWLTARSRRGRASDWAKVALLGMTLFGTLFSIYLTFLEPFVIGATCAWCLTSAVVMTLLMLMTARPAFAALDRLRAS